MIYDKLLDLHCKVCVLTVGGVQRKGHANCLNLAIGMGIGS